MELLVLTIAVLVAAYLAFVIAFPKAVPNEIDDRTQKSLNQIYKENESSFFEQEEKSISNNLQEESVFVQKLFGIPFLGDLYPLIIKAGLKEKLPSLFAAYLLVTCVLVVLLFKAGLSILALLLAPLIGFYLIKRHCKRIIEKRNNAFLAVFPEVLDMFVRSVKSGFPVTSAFRVIAENMDPPASTEFQKIVHELAIGQPMSAVLTRLAERIDEPDINFFVIVMKVQQETGGNLAEVVTNLSNVIRKRKQLRLKIRALTSEGRATSYILGSLPVIVFGALYFVGNGYLDILFTTTGGQIALGIASSLIVGCMLLVNRMTAIDI